MRRTGSSARVSRLSVSCDYGHIQVYSITIVTITLAFFFYISLTYFSKEFEKTCFLTKTTAISLLKFYLNNVNAIYENGVIIELTKLKFSSKSKFYDKKESSLTKYYRIRSKLPVFFLKKVLTFSFR